MAVLVVAAAAGIGCEADCRDVAVIAEFPAGTASVSVSLFLRPPATTLERTCSSHFIGLAAKDETPIGTPIQISVQTNSDTATSYSTDLCVDDVAIAYGVGREASGRPTSEGCTDVEEIPDDELRIVLQPL